MTEGDPRLEAVLSEGKRRGLVGSGDLGAHIEHALGFLEALERGDANARPGARLLDLGSGGGLPGLVLAAARPDFVVTLLDANLRRTSFLGEAVAALDLADRVTVMRARAETSGRDPSLRGSFDLVVARGFGSPAVTAECGAPFLRVGGRLVVSEPPEGNAVGSRWPAEPLAQLGLRPAEMYRADFSYQVLVQERPCPDGFPRKTGVPAKRPLF